MRAWISFIVRNKKSVLVFTFIFTILLLTQFRGLKLIIDPDNILPRDHHFVKTNEVIESTFGNKFTVVITISPNTGDIYQVDFLNIVKLITEDIEKSNGIIKSHFNGIASKNAKVLFKTPFGPAPASLVDLIPAKVEDMERFKQALKSEPIFKGLLYSEDETTTQIIAEYSKIEGGFKAIEKNILQALAPYQSEKITIKVGGLPIFLAALEDFSARMALLFPLALLIIGLIHYEAFRTKQALILPLVTALLAVIWSIGFLGLLKQSFDVFNASTPILILAIAAGHAVQILKRYYEEFHLIQKFQPYLTPAEANSLAVEQALTKVGPVMIIACVVAALGFFSLTIFEVKTIRIFGLFTGFGVISSLIIELTFIPALRACLAPPGEHEKQREQQNTIWDKITEGFYYLTRYKRKVVYIVSTVLLSSFAIGAYYLKIDNSQKGYFFDSLQIKKDDAFMNKKMSGTNLIYILLDGIKPGSVRSPEVIKGLESVQNFLDSQPFVGKTISLNNFIKTFHRKISGDRELDYQLPTLDPQILGIIDTMTSHDVNGDLQAWISKDQSKAVIATFIKTDSSTYIEELAEKTKNYSKTIFPSGINVDIGGGAVNGVALNEVLIREKILNILQILFAVFIVTAIVFRSIAAGLLILIPLLAAVIVNFGIMGILGIPLQIATALVSAMAVGIGADYGIYMSYRMREELRKGENEEQALKDSFRSAGKATLFVSSAVAGGFGILMLSWGFYIHIWMGFLIATAMLTSSIAALTLFPALIFTLRPKFIFEKE
jgi:predicted RND superfamily exporter protein